MTPSSQPGLTLGDFPPLSFAFSPNADDPPHSAPPPPVPSPSSPANVSAASGSETKQKSEGPS
jgi:hypothetical protein